MARPVGRPTLSSTEPTDRIEVKMPASLKRRAAALAELRGLDLSAMIRRWLDEQVDDAERVRGAALSPPYGPASDVGLESPLNERTNGHLE